MGNRTDVRRTREGYSLLNQSDDSLELPGRNYVGPEMPEGTHSIVTSRQLRRRSFISSSPNREVPAELEVARDILYLGNLHDDGIDTSKLLAGTLPLNLFPQGGLTCHAKKQYEH